MNIRLLLLSTCLFAFACPGDGEGDDGSVQQTGQINTQADIKNNLEAQGLHLQVTGNCNVINIVTADGTVRQTASVGDINSAIGIAKAFGTITEQQADSSTAVLEEALRNADCPAPGN